ncbi:MAG TPA: (Fe-S)-binding protein, partial [Limnochordales bacterium]
MSQVPVPRAGTGASLRMAGDEAARCIHCGFCLPACPTYQVFGQEKHSPRGRIQLVKAWSDGRIEPDPSLIEALDLCLGCRACETACPVNVHYGVILEGARDELARRRSRRLMQVLQRWVLRHIAAHPGRLGLLARLTARLLHSAAGRLMARAARRPHGWLAAVLPFARALPGGGGNRRGAGARRQPKPPPTSSPAAPVQPVRAALFLGCAQEGLFPDVNAATAKLLAAAGLTVEIPANQGCCGALHRHQGDVEHARFLIRRNLEAFGFLGGNPPDVVVLNAGGCLAWLKEAASLFAPDTPEHTAARQLAARARDISEVLLERGWRPAGAGVDRPLRVVYQPSCHLSHVCGVTEAPLALLRALPGVTVSLPADGGACCGSAGIYNALHPQASAGILARKMQHIAPAGPPPDVIVTSNPGCHLQLLAGVRQAGLAE